ncbi:MAG: hypothetical protein E6G10_06460 [Actinobacteria bacterium]|nr:MAG: hypothetical protein E6G10_06460 [Actinomycetota bacterium]
MPPEPRLVPRFAAEPPQDVLPYGRWAERLRSEFLAAAADLDDVGEPGELVFYPDRTWHGRTWVPVTAPTSAGLEIVGFVSFRAGADGGEPTAFTAHADATEETAARHPEWQLDLNDEVVGSWRGEQRQVAAMTLVWGTPLVPGGAVATAELAGLVVDQCELREGRFTLLAPDDYRGDLLDIRLFNERGEELARESLYDEAE